MKKAGALHRLLLEIELRRELAQSGMYAYNHGMKV